MPGCWEVQSRPNVLVAILTRETVTTKWAANHRNMFVPANSSITYIHGRPFDDARNTAVRAMLEQGYEWLMFVDDDVCLPHDTIPRLMAHGKDIVSGIYYRRAQPIMPVMLRYKTPHEAEWIQSWSPPGALFEVDLVGAGCLLIHRRVFEKMPFPWFLWELDMPNPCKRCGKEADPGQECEAKKGAQHDPTDPALIPKHSEDFAFCKRAKRQHGMSIWVDSSIICEHIGYAASSGGQAATYQPAGI